MTLFIMVMVFGLVLSLFDAWTTITNVKKGYIETGPLKVFIGAKPTVFGAYAAAIIPWLIILGLCVFSYMHFDPSWVANIPMLGIIGAHLYGGIHNYELK